MKQILITTIYHIVQAGKRKENKMAEKRDYIVGVSGVDYDGVDISRIYGTEKQVKKYLLNWIKEEREGREDEFEDGTESVDEIEVLDSGKINAYNCFNDGYTYYSAYPINCLETIML